MALNHFCFYGTLAREYGFCTKASSGGCQMSCCLIQNFHQVHDSTPMYPRKVLSTPSGKHSHDAAYITHIDPRGDEIFGLNLEISCQRDPSWCQTKIRRRGEYQNGINFPRFREDIGRSSYFFRRLLDKIRQSAAVYVFVSRVSCTKCTGYFRQD